MNNVTPSARFAGSKDSVSKMMLVLQAPQEADWVSDLALIRVFVLSLV